MTSFFAWYWSADWHTWVGHSLLAVLLLVLYQDPSMPVIFFGFWELGELFSDNGSIHWTPEGRLKALDHIMDFTAPALVSSIWLLVF